MGWLGLELMGKQFQKYLSPKRKGWPCRRSGWGLTEEEERRVNAYCTGRPIPTHPLWGKNQRKAFPDNLVQKVIAGCKTHKWPPTGRGRVGERDLCNLLTRVSPILNRILQRQPGGVISTSLSISHRSDTLRLCFNSGQQSRFRLICVKIRWII